MLERFEITDVVPEYENRTFEEIVKEDRNTAKKIVFDKIREGYEPSDEVLAAAGIKKHIRDEKFTHVMFDRTKLKDNKVYPKETKKLETILKEINTLENNKTNENE